MTQISITTAPLNLLSGHSYSDLLSTLDTMKRIKASCTVDGFELQDLAEWDARGPPRDVRTKGHRLNTWDTCGKFTVEEMIRMTANSSILSVHANRDVGIYLCSENETERIHGRELIKETLDLATAIGVKVAVFHLWDTWSPNFDPLRLKNELHQLSSAYPSVIASVENVPTHLEGFTPFSIVKEFDSITLDTRWAGMYDELEAFSDVSDKIVNVHLRGSLEANTWQLHDAPFSFNDALTKINIEWGYSELFTIEPERSMTLPTWEGILEAMNGLKQKIM